MAKLSGKYQTSEFAEHHVRVYLARASAPTAAGLVSYLAEHKFVIAQSPYEKPARRGKAIPKYTGPAMIGRSHSATMVGGAKT